MLGLERLADWWDSQHGDSERILQEWVNTSGSDYELYARAAAATVLQTSMVLGSGFVDVLRIGEGVRNGGVWGYTQDALRLLSLAGPIVRLGRLGAARWVFNPRGPICTTVALTGAMRRTGTRLFITVADIIRRRGGSLAAAHITEYLPILRSLGARFSQINSWSLSSLRTITQNNPKSVILFSVQWTSGGILKAHTMYAFRDILGRFKIADRTGTIVSSLQELESLYPDIGTAISQNVPALLVHNSIIVEGTSMLSMLAIEVDAMLQRNGGDRQVVFVPVQ